MAHASSLAGLPDDLLLDVIEHLDTARDVSHLGQATERTRRLVQQIGWKAFVKTRFPALRAPGEEDVSWIRVAERLTYLDRCWDKRAVRFSLFRTRAPPKRRRRRAGGGAGPPGQAIGFQGVVDARYVAGLDRELVAFGAGEDLHLRWTAAGTGDDDRGGGGERAAGVWGSILGRHDGIYHAGTGDVTSLKVIERPVAAGGRDVWPQLLVGRGNGDVEVLSAAEDETFGTRMEVIRLYERQDADENTHKCLSALGISPGRLAVNCTEWQPDSEMLAASRSSHLHLYKMPAPEVDGASPDPGLDPGSRPLAFHDMSLDRPSNQESSIRDIKFLDKDRFAVALGGNAQPVQYATVRPTGVVFEPAAHNSIRVHARKEGKLLQPTTVWAIQPVGHRNSRNLLLSSWQDGTFRLLDARTPSTYDAIYRDNFQPYQAGGPLLVYGAERFVTSNNTTPTIRFFDFRFDKPYFHSSASPCSPAQPLPRVSCSSKTMLERNGVMSGKCSINGSGLCTWHALSRTDCYRQDASLWLAYRGMDRVFSLAKPSDTSDRFYLGLRGAIAEAQLVLNEDVPLCRANREVSCPQGWQVSDTNVTVAETGVGLCSSSVHDGLHGELHCGMPELFHNEDTDGKKDSDTKLQHPPERSRLDTALRKQSLTWRRGVEMDGP